MKKLKGGAQFNLMRVQHYGEIGAGRAVDNVLPFISRGDLVPVVAPVNLSVEDVGVLTVRGISLEDEGIFDGDVLIFCRRFTRKDITPDTICVVYLHSTGELVAKKIICEANMLRLRASNRAIPDRIIDPDDVEIRGTYLGFQRFTKPVRAALKEATNDI